MPTDPFPERLRGIVPAFDEARDNHLYLLFRERRERVSVLSGPSFSELASGTERLCFAVIPFIVMLLGCALLSGESQCVLCLAPTLIVPIFLLIRSSRNLGMGVVGDGPLPLRLCSLFKPGRPHRNGIIDLYLSGSSGKEVLEAIHVEMLERRTLHRWPIDLLFLASVFLVPIILTFHYGNLVMLTFVPGACWLAAEFDRARFLVAARHIQRVELGAVLDLWSGRNVVKGRIGRTFYQIYESFVMPFFSVAAVCAFAALGMVMKAADHFQWNPSLKYFVIAHVILLEACIITRRHNAKLADMIGEESSEIDATADELFRDYVQTEFQGTAGASD